MENTMCFEKKRGKAFWMKRIVFVPIAMAAGLFVFGSLVMLLWNAILPEVFGVVAITFWQAIGILLLSKILFGGFPGRHDKRGFRRHSHDIREKLNNLTPEEKEKMRKEWLDRFENQTK
jgi:hypothetical protein